MSLTPNIIAAIGEQENINNDAVYLGRDSRAAANQQPSLACQT